MRLSMLVPTALVAVALMCAAAGGHYQITPSVIGGGGGGSGGSYTLVGTVGQPAIGVTAGGSYRNEIGFWYQPGWVLTGVEDALGPTSFRLDQNFPNPFNPRTTFRFAVPSETRVSVKLYDVAGREIRTLVDDTFEPGFHTVPLHADGLVSGVYFCRMTAGTFIETKKVILLK